MPVSAGLSPEESRQLLDLSTNLKRQGGYAEALAPTAKLHEFYPPRLFTIYWGTNPLSATNCLEDPCLYPDRPNRQSFGDTPI
jgi:hypothetical protein